jgi:hypothetical protein
MAGAVLVPFIEAVFPRAVAPEYDSTATSNFEAVVAVPVTVFKVFEPVEMRVNVCVSIDVPFLAPTVKVYVFPIRSVTVAFPT